MSKMLKLVAVAALTALSACGGETYTLSDGNYAVSNLTIVSDQCDLKSALEGMALVVKVDSATDAISIDFESIDETAPKGTIADNAFTANREGESDFSGCKVKGVRTITGDLTANDQFDGTAEYQLEIVSGGAACTAENLGFNPPKCVSKFTFSASK